MKPSAGKNHFPGTNNASHSGGGSSKRRLLEISESQIKCQRIHTEDQRCRSVEADTHGRLPRHHEYRRPMLPGPRLRTAAGRAGQGRAEQPSQQCVLLSLLLTGTAESSSLFQSYCNTCHEATSPSQCQAPRSPTKSTPAALTCSRRGNVTKGEGSGGGIPMHRRRLS